MCTAGPASGTAVLDLAAASVLIFILIFFFFLYNLKCQGWELCAGVRYLLSVYRIPAAAAAWNLLHQQQQKSNKTEEKEDDGSRFSHLGGTKQIQSGCKLCCRYVESIVDVSV